MSTLKTAIDDVTNEIVDALIQAKLDPTNSRIKEVADKLLDDMTKGLDYDPIRVAKSLVPAPSYPVYHIPVNIGGGLKVADVKTNTHTVRGVLNHFTNPECTHEWKEYVGLMNTFHYCVKCDTKKSDA